VASVSKSPLKALAAAILPRLDAPTPDFKPELEDQDEQVAAFVERSEAAMPLAKPVAAPARPVAEVPSPRPDNEVDPIRTASVEPEGWVVQVASSPSKADAAAALESASHKASNVLASATAYTVPFEKGGVTYHRARFGGFDSKVAARKACAQLQKKNIACYAVQN
jgi:D-alanyl-D-alanine carboxypeptidase